MDERVVPTPKPTREDVNVLTDGEDGAGGTYGLWCLTEVSRGPLVDTFSMVKKM